MSYAIRVQKSRDSSEQLGPDLFVQRFNSPEEYQSVLKLCDNKRRINWLESMLIPARTDTLANFCKDLFLPRFFDEALKIKELGLKILVSIGTIMWGIITFPIRCITAIPWYIYSKNHPKEAHPFYQYLIKNGVAPADLSKDHVYLETKEIWAPKPNVDLSKKAHPFYQHLIYNKVERSDLCKDYVCVETKEIGAPKPNVDRYLAITRGDTFNFRRMLDSVGDVRYLFSSRIMSQKELSLIG